MRGNRIYHGVLLRTTMRRKFCAKRWILVVYSDLQSRKGCVLHGRHVSGSGDQDGKISRIFPFQNPFRGATEENT